MPPTNNTPSTQVLHIRRADEADSYVLLHVLRSDSSALELSITATEGESPYFTTVRQAQLKKLRAKNYQGSDDEWKSTILYVLGLQDEVSEKSDIFKGIEASASLTGSGDEDKEMVITIRKRIQTITQKLGSLTLNQDDEREIELYEWSNVAISRADTLQQRLASVLDRYHAAEDTINQLNKQLEEFISSKNQHEQQLMSDFAQLLNEKKLKIRNQQRLLASVKVDPEKLSTMQEPTTTSSSNPNTKGRGSKRAAEDVSDDESEIDDGFEKMGVDKRKQRVHDCSDQDTDDGGNPIPQAIEDEDNTTSDEGCFGEPIENSRGEDKRRQSPPERVVTKSPPPRRELPFARKTQRVSAPKRRPPAKKDPDEMGGETDDDEL